MYAHLEKTSDAVMVFRIKADRFLRNMVRAMVGATLLVGRGKLSLEEFRAIIEQSNRCKASDSALAQALCLVDIEYPSELFE